MLLWFIDCLNLLIFSITIICSYNSGDSIVHLELVKYPWTNKCMYIFYLKQWTIILSIFHQFTNCNYYIYRENICSHARVIKGRHFQKNFQMNLRYGQITSISNGIWELIKPLWLKYLSLLHISNDLILQVDARIPLYFYMEIHTLEENRRKMRLFVSIIDYGWESWMTFSRNYVWFGIDHCHLFFFV